MRKQILRQRVLAVTLESTDKWRALRFSLANLGSQCVRQSLTSLPSSQISQFTPQIHTIDVAPRRSFSPINLATCENNGVTRALLTPVTPPPPVRWQDCRWTEIDSCVCFSVFDRRACVSPQWIVCLRDARLQRTESMRWKQATQLRSREEQQKWKQNIKSTRWVWTTVCTSS